MKKRSIAAKLGVAALALTLVTTSLSSGTFAKYTSTVQANANLTIAKWNVGATLQNADGTKSVTMAAAVPETKLALADTAEGVQANTVAATYLAPGMKGMVFAVVNPTAAGMQSTDVAVKYEIYVKKSDTAVVPANFTFWDAGLNGTVSPNYDVNKAIDFTVTTENPLDDPELGFKVAEGVIGLDKINQTQKYGIGWTWPYDTPESDGANDSKDTEDGSDRGRSSGVFTFTVRMTQANPNEALPTPAP